ncbi:TPA: DUF551 domain-containing protein [Escherichia coli]|nr:DUF551 domain-containing protein [Escherichia coli]
MHSIASTSQTNSLMHNVTASGILAHEMTHWMPLPEPPL